MAITRKVAGFISACVCATASPALAGNGITVPPAGGIVSTGLCADAYVLALVEAERIAALSWQVDQALSQAPDWARERPVAWVDAERLYALSPDLAVFDAGSGGRVARLLDRAGLAHVQLIWGDDFDTVRANFGALGAVTQSGEAAEAAIGQLDQRLAELARRAEARGTVPRVLYLSASGASAGSGTYINAAITAAGGRNVMADAGVQGWTRSDPELFLTIEADIVLTSFFTDGFLSTSNHARHHAAYRRVLEGAVRADIPAGHWPCAGPHLIDAAERIAGVIDDWEAAQ